MKQNSRAQVLAMIAVVDAVILLASLWMRWGTLGFGEGAGDLGFLDAFELEINGWETRDYLDVLLAGVAVLAIVANGAVALDRSRALSGGASLIAGVIAGGVVAWTMIDPPLPPAFDIFNAIPGLPDLQLEPAYGIFVALAAAVGLILTGVLQLSSGGGAAESPEFASAPPSQLTPATPSPPDPFAKTPPPDPFAKGPGSTPPPQPDSGPDEPFIDPVSGEPADR